MGLVLIWVSVVVVAFILGVLYEKRTNPFITIIGENGTNYIRRVNVIAVRRTTPGTAVVDLANGCNIFIPADSADVVFKRLARR